MAKQFFKNFPEMQYKFDSGKLKGSKAEERGGGLFQIMNLYLNMNMVSEASVLFQDENGNVLTWHKNQSDFISKIKNLLAERKGF